MRASTHCGNFEYLMTSEWQGESREGRVDEVRPVKLAVNDETQGIPARQTLAVKVDKRKTSVEAGR